MAVMADLRDQILQVFVDDRNTWTIVSVMTVIADLRDQIL